MSEYAKALPPLTDIERTLVLQYLRDANVPVTLSPVAAVLDGATSGADRAAVFPVVARGAESGAGALPDVIELQNPTEAVSAYAGQAMRVEFYFNKMGLTFTTEMTSRDGRLCMSIPSVIEHITDHAVRRDVDFSCNIYYSCSNNAKVNFECLSDESYTLFERPVWKDIPTEHQWKAKTYLERFAASARTSGAYNNGLFLIPICHYLTDLPLHLSSVEGRLEPFTALYIDHERLVFGCGNGNLPLVTGAEYAVKMSFAIRKETALTREVFATMRLGSVYGEDAAMSGSPSAPRAGNAAIYAGGERLCADCLFTSLKEEDRRFLYEKATKKVFEIYRSSLA